MSGTQIDLFTPQFNFDGKIRRVTLDGIVFASVYDVLDKYTNDSNPRRLYARAMRTLEAQGAVVPLSVQLLRMHQFPGERQRETPVGSIEFFIRLAQVIEIPEWESIRQWMTGVVVERLNEQPKIAPPRNGKERTYLARQIVQHGMDRPAALEQLQYRRDTKSTYRALTAAINECVHKPNYGKIVNTEYVGLFGRTAAELRAILDCAEVRDALDPLQLQTLRTAEMMLTRAIQRQRPYTNDDVIRLIDTVVVPLGALLEEVTNG